MRLLLATTNPGKIEKIRQLLKDISLEIVNPNDVGLSDVKIEENGKTIEDNARLKARGFFQIAKERGFADIAVLADDGGLEIDALNGEPGPRAQRWAGEPSSDERLIAHAMKELEGIPRERRTARFRVVQVVIFPGGREDLATGVTEGWISEIPLPMKTPGLPYSAILYTNQFGKTLDDLESHELEQTHRGQALNRIRDIILQNATKYA